MESLINKIKMLVKNARLIAVVGVLLILALISVAVYLKKTEVLPQASVHFLNDISMPKAGDRVMIVSPHPDDETIAAGGFIAMAVKNNTDVKVVLVTDGNKRGLKETRYKEFKKSTGVLGVDEKNLVFLNFADGSLKKTDQNLLYNKIAEQINSFDPDFIVFPNPKDDHPDHATTGKTVEKILSDRNDKNVHSLEYLVHHRHFPQPKKLKIDGFLLPPISLVRFDEEWQKLMLSPDIEAQKEKAMLSYKSQLRVPLLRSLMLSFIRKNELFSINQSLIK